MRAIDFIPEFRFYVPGDLSGFKIYPEHAF